MSLLSDILLITTIVLVSMAPMTASFLQCWADRARAGQTGLPKGRSHCDSCGTRLGAFDLIPIGSWLWSRGKARCCKQPISPTLLWPELAALVCAVWGAWVSTPPLAVVTVALVWILQAIILLHSLRPGVAQGFILFLAFSGLSLSLANLTGPLTAHLVGFGAGLGVVAATRLLSALRPYSVPATLLVAGGALLGAPLLGISVVLGAIAAVVSQTLVPKLGLPRPNGPHAGVLGVAAGLWLTWLYGLAV